MMTAATTYVMYVKMMIWFDVVMTMKVVRRMINKKATNLKGMKPAHLYWFFTGSDLHDINKRNCFRNCARTYITYMHAYMYVCHSVTTRMKWDSCYLLQPSSRTKACSKCQDAPTVFLLLWHPSWNPYSFTFIICMIRFLASVFLLSKLGFFLESLWMTRTSTKNKICEIMTAVSLLLHVIITSTSSLRMDRKEKIRIVFRWEHSSQKRKEHWNVQ